MNVNTDRAYTYIRKRIVSGEYPPGHLLMTEYLSGEIGVSRTPVREALHELRAEGLVTIQARVGASVKQMDPKEFEESCDLRKAVEGHAAGLAALRWNESQLREIKQALELMRSLTEQIIATGSEAALLGDLIRADVRFHIGVITAAQNQLMKREILRMHLVNKVVSGRAIPPADHDLASHRRSVLEGHERIYEAITQRDAVKAEVLMKQHVQEIADRHLQRMLADNAGFVARELSEDELVYGT